MSCERDTALPITIVSAADRQASPKTIDFVASRMLQSIRPKTLIKILFPPQHYINLNFLIKDSIFDCTNRFLFSNFKND
jgi:hypothetical protein